MKRSTLPPLVHLGRPLAAALPAVALLLGGCMTAEQLRADRIQRNQAVFAQLAPEAQQRAAVGTFTIGDPAAAVWFALGEPATKTATATAEGSYETWIYTRLASEPYQVLVHEVPPPPPPGPYGRRPPPPPIFSHYETHYRTIQVPTLQVVFSDGLVSQVTTY